MAECHSSGHRAAVQRLQECVPAELTALLQRQCGVATVDQLTRLTSDWTVRWKVDSGRWQRPYAGVVVTHSGPLSELQRRWVDLLCAGRGAVLAADTAAGLDGLEGYPAERTYLLLPPGRQVTNRPDLVVRRSSFLDHADVHPLHAPPRTRLARSVVDMASAATTDDRARAVLAAAVQQRLVRSSDLRAVVRRLGAVRRRRLILRTLDDIAGGAHSLPELEAVRLVRRFRLPAPSRQVVRRDRSGRRRWLDLYWEAYRLVVEIDGRWHMEVRAWWDAMWRDAELVVAGERVLRYPSFAVREQPALVAAQIAAVLRANGWDGRRGAR